jgi:hypothetical protein
MVQLVEGFDDITTLTGKGWIQTNNSSPLGETSWLQGAPPIFLSQAGASDSYMAASYDNAGSPQPATISNWLLSPVVSIQNGDTLSFYTRTTGNVPTFPDRLQVLLSLNGSSTDVGATATSVGDFTTTLLDINPNLTTTDYPTTFTKYDITLAGIPTPTMGRFAFRYFIPTDAGPSGTNGDYIGIDTFSYTSSAPNDINLAISSTDANKPEGNSGNTPFTFTVTRAGNTSIATTASWSVTGSALNPVDAADFGGALPTGTVTFAIGEPTKDITVNVNGDNVSEPNENFTVTLSNPSAPATITTATAAGTIQDDDSSALAIAADSSATATEGNSGTKAFTFTVTRSGDTSGSSTSDWTVAGSGANPANATDFGGTLPTGTVSFAANETTKAITVNVSGDSDVEPDENFTVTLANPSGAAIATATATGTIQNDDTLPLPNIAIAADPSATATEGNSGTKAFTFTVTRTGSTSSSSTADWTVTSTGANPANATDFGGTLPTGTVNFAPNETSKTITVNVSGDTAVEPDENFTVTLSNPSGAAITNATATGTIQNDDAGLAIAATNGTQTEGNSGTKAFTFTVTRSGNTSGASTANWTVAGTGANPANAADFGATLPTGTVSFAANETTKTITVNVNGDTVVEPDENFTVTLANPTGAAIITATSTGTIQNDDTNLAIAADPTAIQSEGNSSATAFTFTVTRNGATTSSTSASWAVTGGTTNPANAADFVGNALPKGTVSFATGETSKTVTVNVNGDTQFEPGENFVVTLSAPTGGATIATATATGTIQNDDSVNLAIAPTNAVQDEGNTGAKPIHFYRNPQR